MNDKEKSEDEIGASNDRSVSTSPTQTDVEELRKKLKPPDNKKFDRELEKLNAAIRQKEAKFRSFPKSSRSSTENTSSSSHHAFKDRETLMAELRGYKAEREKEIETRKKIDQDLKAASALVQSKTEACGKLQAGLKYKKESKVEEAIRRLEHQMRVQQLKLREEKRIVTDIDALRRSKKLIHDFDMLKNEIDDLRDKQHFLRSKRDGCMKVIARLKSKEEEVKKALDEQRHKADEARSQQKEYMTEKNAIKKEIDELYDKKRALIAGFNKEKDEYYNILRDLRFQEKQIKREMEITSKSEEWHSQKTRQSKDMNEQSMFVSSHEKMVALCDTLVNYLERMNIDICTKPDYEDSPTFQEQSQEVQGAAASFSGGTFLKKKNDEDLEGMYGGISRKASRKSKKGRKSTQKENIPKKLVLHPLVLEQFLSLYITPPSTASDIPKTLELLHEKKEVLCAVLANPDVSLKDSEPWATSSTETFPSLPSQNSDEKVTVSTASSADDSILKDAVTVPTTTSENSITNSEEQDQAKDNSIEQETVSTASSADDNILKDAVTVPTTTSENGITNSEEQDQVKDNSIEQETVSTAPSADDRILKDAVTVPTTTTENGITNSEEQDQVKDNSDSSNNSLENNAQHDNTNTTNEDLRSHLNGNEDSIVNNSEPSDSHDVVETDFNLDNGIDDSETEHTKINDIQDAEEDKENLTENHTNNEENFIINQSIKSSNLKNNFEKSLCEQNNVEYASNEFRNCDSQEENLQVCSKEVLPQQVNDQVKDSERAIDCPS